MKSTTILILSCLMTISSLTASGSATPSHTIWNGLLQRHVSSNGDVDYTSFKRDARFAEYLALLSGNHPDDTWSKNEKLAFWINAYNAFTVKLVTDNLPLKSIKDLGEPWDMKFIDLQGNRYSLNDIEHKILRVEFAEPRIHFAINCASKSCPPLDNRAFMPNTMDSQLSRVTRAFVNNASHNSIDPDAIELSALFDWFRSDFDKKGGLIEFLNRYSNRRINSSAAITFKKYDWTLNSK